MADIPLIRNFDAGAAFAFRNRRPVRVEEFLGEVRRLADLLPDRHYVVNLCSDRYQFTVGLCAALLRRQVNLLPPNATPDLLKRLSLEYPGLYCLSDGAVHPLEMFLYRQPPGGSADTASVPHIPAEQVATIGFTSGSTGQPIPHPKSWGALAKSGLAEFERLGVAAHRNMSVLGTVPQQHMYGLEFTVLMVMQGGLAMHAGRPFFPSDICAELDALPRPRGLVTTPVHLRVLLAEASELPSVDFLLCATAPLSPQLAIEAETRFAAPLHEIYGCTEAGQIGSRRPAQTHEWRPLPGVSFFQDEKGTWVKGGHVENEVLLADVIELRNRNIFLLHGRTADLVNIAGKRTSLAHLNFHLNSIEGVRDGAFVMPEENDGTVTRLTAFVVAPGLAGETIMAALRRRIDAAFLPRPLCFVEALPRNETGKLPRMALDDLVARLAKAG
ncbi:MAG: acyl-CoA synthetase [Betaproteobacteria bacterium]|nr:MAG: acyl-CoA synthetase [Betaproteobacteria bacterium]